MWNEKELLKEIDNYYNNTSEEQFLKDVEKADYLLFVEDIK